MRTDMESQVCLWKRINKWLINPLAVIVAFLVLTNDIFAASPEQANEQQHDSTPKMKVISESTAYFRTLLYQASYSEGRYWSETLTGGSDIDRSASLSNAIDAWMQVWRCYGYAPAVKKVRALAVLDPKVERHVGYSADLTIEADATWMELKNEAFADYSIFLFRVVDRWYEPLSMKDCTIRILDTKGKLWNADAITPTHKLWKNLDRMAEQFKIGGTVAPGFTNTYKQVFATKNLRKENIRLIYVDTGRGTVVIPFFENIDNGFDVVQY